MKIKKVDILVILLGTLLTVAFSTMGACSTMGTSSYIKNEVGQQYTIKIANNQALGNYLVDSRGMTLYYCKKDSIGLSNVLGDDLKIWPVFYVENYVLPPGLNYNDFGALQRDLDTRIQTTFRRWPLYYFINDRSPGDVLGNGFANLSYVIDPNNFDPNSPPH
jgi:predicted lipoprotein with Yx(FWY)xxD motif